MPANTGLAAVGQAAQGAPGGVAGRTCTRQSGVKALPCAAQGHGVQFQVAGGRFGPLGAEGNLATQQTAGPGRGPAAVLDAGRAQQPIQRGATGREQGLEHFGLQPAMVGPVVGQPLGQAAGFQAHSTGLEGRQSDGLQRRQQSVGRVCLGPTADAP